MNLLVTLTVLVALSINVVSSQRRHIERGECLDGDGSSYRGNVSRSSYGGKCVRWNRFSNQWGASKGIDNHNYCRNPDQSLKPWCRVKRGKRYVREFCDIRKCNVDTELTCGERSERRMHKIVGGSFTPIESHPWVAAIFTQSSFLCGGSLIAPSWVLTAAHCFSYGDENQTEHLSVYLGKTAINDTDFDKEQSFIVEKLIVHQGYSDFTFNNDIALLKIRSKAGGCAEKSAFTRTVCLPPAHTQLPSGFQCSIAGFGKERYGAWTYSQLLKQAEVNLLSHTQCKSDLYYGDRITRNMFCAATPDWDADACKGDSGGPLVCEVSGRMFLFGVVSWGEDCAKRNKPGVYTQVTNYNTWIADKTGLSRYTEGVMYPQK
ncbi:plasminogen activator, urokinase a [Anabas testudineus]|uniref:trypsin n=1 Tax=Anabas testudineus TaxID=64144 RepID=A0A3Q1JMQ4_ANATE|nr:plasminogen activator, urokinase a [Anabas testudineus]